MDFRWAGASVTVTALGRTERKNASTNSPPTPAPVSIFHCSNISLFRDWHVPPLQRAACGSAGTRWGGSTPMNSSLLPTGRTAPPSARPTRKVKSELRPVNFSLGLQLLDLVSRARGPEQPRLQRHERPVEPHRQPRHHLRAQGLSRQTGEPK